MYIKSAKLTFRVQHANSLKDKRQVARSVMDKARHKFNASIAEVDKHDAHRVLVVGISLVSASEAHGQNSLDEIIRFMEANANAELAEVEFWD